MKSLGHTIYRFDDFRLDVAKRQLLRAGRPVVLQGKAFELLRVLVEHSGRVLTKEELYQLVWPDQIVEESNLTVHMSAVRKALGDRASQPRYVTTISGRGYRFVADVHEPEDEAEEVVVEQHTLSRVVVEEERLERDENGEAAAPSDGDMQNGAFLSVDHDPVIVGNGKSASLDYAQLPSAPPVPRGQSKSRAQIFAATGLLCALLAVVGLTYWRSKEKQAGVAAPSQLFQPASIKRLTTRGSISTATLSPDGKLFVYTLGEKELVSLWLGHTDGGEPILLRPPAEVSYNSLNFAPDGNSFYYILSELRQPRGTLYRSPAFGGVPEKLRGNVHNSIAFAPDWKRFAYVRNDEDSGTSSIVIAELAGAATRELTSRPLARAFYPRSLSWSPDGGAIAASAVGDDETSYEIFTVTVADGSVKQLTASAWNLVRSIAWLKDDSGFVVVAQDKNSYDASQLWQVSSASGEARPLYPDLNTYGSALGLSADNRALLTVQAQGMPNVWVAPAEDLSRARQITFGSFGRRDGWMSLEWTPDGKLLYGAYVNRSLTIWTMDADGGNQKQLTSAGYLDQRLSVTADGRTIVFQSNRNGRAEIWRMNSDGSDLRQLTAGGNNTEPTLAPDGKWIVYRGRDKSLWRMSSDGGDAVRLTARAASDPRISPDGKFVACGYNADGKTKLAVLSVEGGELLKLFDVPRTANFTHGIRWTPDGNAVTYRDWHNGIWKQPLDGGEPNRLEGLPEEKLYFYEWSRDGKQFAFVRGVEISDVVLLRDFN